MSVVRSSQELGLSLTFLTSVNKSCWRVNIGSSSQGNPGAVSSLGRVVLGSGQGDVRIERSNGT